jgi:hypothetical protein
VAAVSGVTIERPACLEFLGPRGGDPLGVCLRRPAGVAVEVTTSFVIEATGRRAVPGPAADECARRLYFDRLVAVAVPADRHDDVLRVAPSRSGWWYTAGPVAVFVTDGDLLPRTPSALAAHLERERGDAGTLPIAAVDAAATRVALAAVRDARTGCRHAQRRGRWLPIGDSAFTLDPLSGSGLTRALRMAEAATAAVERYLGAGDPAALSAFALSGCGEFAAARTHGARLYARGAFSFAGSEFWRRRSAGAGPHGGPRHPRRPHGARGLLTAALREPDHPEPQEGEP